MLIDTHAHLNFKEFGKEIPEVIKRAEIAGVGAIINVGSNFETSKKTIEITKLFSSSAEHENVTDKIIQQSQDCQTISKVYAAVGCHPIHLVKDIVEEATFDGRVYKFKTKQENFDYEKYKKLASSSDKVVAIGETGLDYFRLNENNKFQNPNDKLQINSKSQISNYKPFAKSSIKNLDFAQGKQIQKKVFEEHIRLARELNLPLILHCRGSENNPYDAYDEMLGILKSEILNRKSKMKAAPATPESNSACDGGRGVIHCFGGNLKQAKEFFKLGFYLGFTGIVTFKNALEIQEVARQIPLEKILIETDCPFLVPRPLTPELYPKGFFDNRGKPARNACGNAWQARRNEPAYVVEVARKIAELKNISLEEVEKITTQNAINLFSL